MKSSLKNMVLVLFTITAISAALVALVNDVTKDAIAQTEENNRNAAKLEVLPSFEGEAELDEQTKKIGDFMVNVTKVVANGATIGYAVEAPSIITPGYADRIVIMVGFVEKADGVEISGVKVLLQKETPGLGANMIKPGNKLESSILGVKAESLKFEVKKDNPDGSFDALTGSTISSRAYANAVETAYAGYLWYKSEFEAEQTVADEVEGVDDDECADNRDAELGEENDMSESVEAEDATEIEVSEESVENSPTVTTIVVDTQVNEEFAAQKGEGK